MDSTSYDLYETQTHNTGISSPLSEFDEIGTFSQHPDPLISRPPIPKMVPHGQNGLPPVSAVNKINVRAEVLVTKPSYDLTFQNQNFRETPSMGSIQPSNEYWDSSSNLQSNGQAVKYKNTNANNDFQRSVSMATASTFPLQPSRDELATTDGSELDTPIAVHHPFGLPPATAAVAAVGFFSKSYDNLDTDDYDRNRFHRPSLPSFAPKVNVDSPMTPYHKDIPIEKNQFKSDPLLLSQGSDGKYGKDNNSQSSAQPSPGQAASSSGLEGVIETSLDDLERDYALDETMERPTSTYLETNVDESPHRAVQPVVGGLRSAKSQFIPRERPRAGNNNIRRHEQFKALSDRSKSMPLETEM